MISEYNLLQTAAALPEDQKIKRVLADPVGKGLDFPAVLVDVAKNAFQPLDKCNPPAFDLLFQAAVGLVKIHKVIGNVNVLFQTGHLALPP